ncbi:MAG: chemotaxis-specific protein-glutamate methyltransferase CheB [Anaerovibrio sp.]|uniref:chemotaxis-specific protein-glutamate methyltransferase CheB n=1 Tax=Anaerovibrio sp. TaxID=1872532 RepID=UPI0025D97212|nr:chemotaxis-specific protein-glutamate methyltransferase CheB [Anaerovibrio sp.]MCR5176057.1 chemotaxis-specific protein-glutamate methyltransferase CheB [Anaerovibrio sp.]
MSVLKILIVDDSLFFREALAGGLSENITDTVLIERAGNPFEARDKILSFDPDVMVLDVEMPKMNGIEFLRRLIVQYALPTVVLSSRPAYKSLAMEAGAFSFVEKPSTTLGSGEFMRQVAREVCAAKAHGDSLIQEINSNAPVHKETAMTDSSTESDKISSQQIIKNNLDKVVADMKIMAEAARLIKTQSGRREAVSIPLDQIRTPVPPKRVELIAIGASTGGTEALSGILKELTLPLPPIVIVQHIPPMFSKLFSERLHRECDINVKEAEDNDYLELNWVYVAPGNKQMRVKNVGGRMMLDVNPGPKYGGHCPSVDVLFESVADNIGDRAMGVILTGMGEDGAKMMLKMRQAGCVTLGQDEATAVVYGMPRVAYEMGGVVQQVPLHGMAKMITAVARYHQGG